MLRSTLAQARVVPVSRLLVVLLVSVLAAGAMGLSRTEHVAAGAPDHRDQLRFMWAMAGQESGWDYYARNGASGAFGKYQIMPFNWPVWAAEYVNDAQSDQTPYNQERVAYGKIRDLYRWLGSWKRVAYWWLTGRTDKNERRWSDYAKGYVDNIMRLRKRAPARGVAMPMRTSSRPDKGDWRRSGSSLKLRLKAGGSVWSRRGAIRDGQMLKVRSARRTVSGVRWVRVVTKDGRSGWLRQLRTVPARKPASPARWADVRDEGRKDGQRNRKHVRPRPR